MTLITALSTELVLLVASFLSQTDLLNVSLTCKHLKATTEPELYREYVNSHELSRSHKHFVKRLIQRPDLAKHVRRVLLKDWDVLTALRRSMRSSDIPLTYEPTEEEYIYFAESAKDLGIITSSLPYEPRSSVLAAIRENNIVERFDDTVPWDMNFCRFLRIGSEDLYILMLMTMVSHAREIDIKAAPAMPSALPWQRIPHNFKSLRHFTASATFMYPWPLGFFNHALQGGNLEEIVVYGAGNGWRYATPIIEIPLSLHSGSTKITCLV